MTPQALFRVLIVVLVSLYALMPWSCEVVEYRKAILDQNEKWYVDSFYNKEITGTLERIIVFDEDSSEVVLEVSRPGTQIHRTYGTTCVDLDFFSIARPGFLVYKSIQSRTMKFCDDQDRCGSYEINFCGAFD